MRLDLSVSSHHRYGTRHLSSSWGITTQSAASRAAHSFPGTAAHRSNPVFCQCQALLEAKLKTFCVQLVTLDTLDTLKALVDDGGNCKSSVAVVAQWVLFAALQKPYEGTGEDGKCQPIWEGYDHLTYTFIHLMLVVF